MVVSLNSRLESSKEEEEELNIQGPPRGGAEFVGFGGWGLGFRVWRQGFRVWGFREFCATTLNHNLSGPPGATAACFPGLGFRV